MAVTDLSTATLEEVRDEVVARVAAVLASEQVNSAVIADLEELDASVDTIPNDP